MVGSGVGGAAHTTVISQQLKQSHPKPSPKELVPLNGAAPERIPPSDSLFTFQAH